MDPDPDYADPVEIHRTAPTHLIVAAVVTYICTLMLFRPKCLELSLKVIICSVVWTSSFQMFKTNHKLTDDRWSVGLWLYFSHTHTQVDQRVLKSQCFHGNIMKCTGILCPPVSAADSLPLWVSAGVHTLQAAAAANAHISFVFLQRRVVEASVKCFSERHWIIS